jgi:hypothetical protein
MTTDDSSTTYKLIDECPHSLEDFDEINFVCNRCGRSFDSQFGSLAVSCGFTQGFFSHSYVSSINDRFNRYPKKEVRIIRTKKQVTAPSSGAAVTQLSDLIHLQKRDIESKFQTENIPLIEKIPKIDNRTSSPSLTAKRMQSDLFVRQMVQACFGTEQAEFSHIVNGSAIYNTGKQKLAEPCPLSVTLLQLKKDDDTVCCAIVENWDLFIKKLEFIFTEYIKLINLANKNNNKRTRSKLHIEIYIVLLIYHILQFHLTSDHLDINVDTLNECFDLARITVTKTRPSNPKSKVKTVICGLADRLGVGYSTIPRLIVESINFCLYFIKTPNMKVYTQITYI